MEEIRRIKKLTERFEGKLSKGDKKAQQYQEKIASYKKYMAKTDKMLAEANCELMRKEAKLLALGLGLEEKELGQLLRLREIVNKEGAR